MTRKRRSLSDNVVGKKRGRGVASESTQKSKDYNPFELKFNRQKHSVLGKKFVKGTSGVPGLSRQKAQEQREKTLLGEYRRFGKANKIRDRRLGEADPTLSKEERLARRFALEREKRFKKNSIYKLEGDEDKAGHPGEQGEELLTHFGQSLAEIEEHERPLADEDDDHGMDANFVSAAHFGGGGGVGDSENGDGAAEGKSRRDLIQAMIAKSKQMKYEKFQKKEENVSRTEDLDEQWKEMVKTNALSKLLNTGTSDATEGKNAQEEAETKGKSYDTIVRELLFETKRVKAVDKLRTPEEIAREEKEKLEKLEADRIARMKGIRVGHEESSRDRNPFLHQSGDDLDDNLDYGGKSNSRRFGGNFVVRYDKDGKLMNEDELEGKGKGKEKGKEYSGDEDSDEDEEEEEEEEDSGEDDKELDFDDEIPAPDVVPESSKTDEKKKDVAEKIPFVFDMPTSYKDLKSLLDAYPTDSHQMILARLIKCHHPSLKEGNKQKLENLFLLVLRFFDSVSTSDNTDSLSSRLDSLTKILYQLTQSSPTHAGRCVVGLLKRHKKAMEEKKKRAYPGLNFFTLLRLIQALFPVSDLKHTVVTPAIMMASQLLSRAHNKSPQDIVKGLYLAGILSGYFEQSKRYSPEIVGFLLGVLHVSVKNESWEKSPTGAFPISEPHRWMLHISELADNYPTADKLQEISVRSLFHEHSDLQLNDLKVNCISSCLTLIRTIETQYRQLSSHSELFEIIHRLLKRLPTDNYPSFLKKQTTDLATFLEQSIRDTKKRFLKRGHLDKQISAPANSKSDPSSGGIKFLEPKVEQNYNPERSKGHSGPKRGPKADRQRMVKQYKREVRGTMRELRRDNQFLAREKIRENESRDTQRREKTKRLMSGLMDQEAEYKKHQRLKERDKLRRKGK